MDILHFLNFLFHNFGLRLNICCVDKGRGRLVHISRVQGMDSKNVNESVNSYGCLSFHFFLMY